MKITRIELIPIYSTREMGRTGPSDPDGSISHHIILKMHTDAGVTALGEMSDINFTPTKQVVQRLRARLQAVLGGKDPFDLTAIQTDLRRQRWEHQVLCGVDIALHDAQARFLNIPLYQLLGGKYRSRIRFSYPLATCKTEDDVAANLRRIERLVEQGHTTIRYYFGKDLDLDEKLLSEMRCRWGDLIELNALDASGWFTVEEAIAAIDRFAPFNPNLVESPVKGRHNAPVEDFLAVKHAVNVPIGEHVAGFDVAARLARHDAVDVWNLGIGYEGITSTRKLFGMAEVFGIDTLLGSTVEMQIGTAARAHVMASIPNLAHACYPAGPLVYRERITKQQVRYDGGYVYVPEGPGLGVELDEELLERQRLG